MLHGNENKYDFYKIKEDVAKDLLDTFLKKDDKIVNAINEIAQSIGAIGVTTKKSQGLDVVNDFYFAENKIFDFKVSTRECQGHVFIKPYKSTKKGKKFAAEMATKLQEINSTYKDELSLLNWLCVKFDCYRQLCDFPYLRTTDVWWNTDQDLIALSIPKTDKTFVSPATFEKITYGQFYDLING